MKRRDFTKFAILAPIFIFINKFTQKKNDSNELDFIFSKAKRDKKRAVATVVSFLDKDGKTLHYARVLQLDTPELNFKYFTKNHIAGAIERTVLHRAEPKLRDKFNFF